jgi:hypothetical protein
MENVQLPVLKGGTGLVYVPESKVNKKQINKKNSIEPNSNKFSLDGDRIYLLKGTNKQYEFWTYLINQDTWIRKRDAPSGPNSKLFKDGSALVYDGNSTIYALKSGAKINEFYAYDINADTWSLYPGDTLPLKHPDCKKKAKVKQGGAMTLCDSKIYAIKGGKSNDFWCYTESSGVMVWQPSDTIPRITQNSAPGAGASLTTAFGYIYLLKGNKTNEFYAWIPHSEKQITSEKQNRFDNETNSNIQEAESGLGYDLSMNVRPNPCNKFTVISYVLPIAGPVLIKLYNANGQVIKMIDEKNSGAGKYNHRLMTQNLSPGIYFISIKANQKELISKLVIQ